MSEIKIYNELNNGILEIEMYRRQSLGLFVTFKFIEQTNISEAKAFLFWYNVNKVDFRDGTFREGFKWIVRLNYYQA